MYVVAVGGITVYVHHPFMALFASSPYTSPDETDSATGEFDLSAHLTNTCLQTAVLGEEAPQVSVSTLQSMADKVILSGQHKGEKLGAERIEAIEERVRETVAEVFKAAVGAGSSFQVRRSPSPPSPACADLASCSLYRMPSRFSGSISSSTTISAFLCSRSMRYACPDSPSFFR